MESQNPLTAEQQRYANRSYEQWLELEETQAFIQRLRQWTKLPPPVFHSVEDVQTYQANAITKGAYQEIIDLIFVPPYPSVEDEAEQQLLDI